MSTDGFYFDDFLKFAQNFEKTLQEENFILDVMNQLGNVALSEVKQRTPVGHYDGTVFFVTANNKLAVFQGAKNARTGGELRRNWELEDAKKVGDTYIVTIFNPTEYASWVENGHRNATHTGWVEGKFMLKLTMADLVDQLPAIVGPMYRDYLEKFGVS